MIKLKIHKNVCSITIEWHRHWNGWFFWILSHTKESLEKIKSGFKILMGCCLMADAPWLYQQHDVMLYYIKIKTLCKIKRKEKNEGKEKVFSFIHSLIQLNLSWIHLFSINFKA